LIVIVKVMEIASYLSPSFFLEQLADTNNSALKIGDKLGDRDGNNGADKQ
jgi:hypothetical protein